MDENDSPENTLAEGKDYTNHKIIHLKQRTYLQGEDLECARPDGQ